MTILIVVTSVYLGNVVSMQEFNSLQACEKAALVVLSQKRFGISMHAECVPK